MNIAWWHRFSAPTIGDNRSDAPTEPPTDPDVVLHSGELVAGRLTDQELKRSSAFRLAAHLAEQIHGLSSPGMGEPQRARLPALDVADGPRTTGLSSGMIARPESSWPRRCTAWPLPRRSPRPILTPVQGPLPRPHAARGGEAPTHCVTGAATGGPSPPAIRRAA